MDCTNHTTNHTLRFPLRWELQLGKPSLYWCTKYKAHTNAVVLAATLAFDGTASVDNINLNPQTCAAPLFMWNLSTIRTEVYAYGCLPGGWYRLFTSPIDPRATTQQQVSINGVFGTWCVQLVCCRQYSTLPTLHSSIACGGTRTVQDTNKQNQHPESLHEVVFSRVLIMNLLFNALFLQSNPGSGGISASCYWISRCFVLLYCGGRW